MLLAESILYQMDSNRARCLPYLKVAEHGVSHHISQVLPVIGFSEDAVTDGPGLVPALGGFPHLEGDLVV